LPHLRIDAEVHAAVLLIDELVEFQPAVADHFCCGQILKPVHMEVGCVSKRVRRVWYAAHGLVHFGIAIAAGDLDHQVKKISHRFHLVGEILQVLHMLGRRRVLDSQRERRAGQSELFQPEVRRELHRLSLVSRLPSMVAPDALQS
jgi:hypothetical protein